MPCAAVAPWGDVCVLLGGHVGDHLTEAQRVAREAAAVVWRAERDAFWEACARRARERERAKVREVPVPIVLVPTPAQRAAGKRIVDARDDQMPAAARRLRDQLTEARILCRATYAHALMPPKRGADDWWDNYSVALRVQRADGTRGWGCWSNGKWDAGMWAGRLVGAREFAALCVGVSDVQLDSQVRQLVGSAA